MIGNVWVALPLACLGCGAFAVYLAARLLPARLEGSRNRWLAACTAMVFGAALATIVPLSAATRAAYHAGRALPTWGRSEAGGAFLQADPGALVIVAAALGLGGLVAIYSGHYISLDRRYETYYPLLLLLVVGLVGMVLAADLFSLYMFCELMSVAAYVLVAFRRRTQTAIEAGFKYLVMGSVGTIILLMGISFVYRERGQIAWQVAGGAAWAEKGPWTRAGLACFLVGLGVKSALVPMHTWLPDAHGRAPSSVSAMLSGVVIQAAFYTLLKAGLGLGWPARDLGTLLVGLSMLNMTLGNGLALVQVYTKRLLAYSSLAQMGYMMFSVGIGLHYGLASSIQAAFFLLVAHAAMKGLAFLCKGVCHFYCDTTTIAQLRGMARRLPLVAVAFVVALGGLAGIPPLAGFAGKWFVLTGALSTPDALAYVGLAVFLINSLLALGYYLPLVVTLFSLPPLARRGVAEGGRLRMSPWMAVPLVILGGLILAIGLYPGPWLDLTADAGSYLLALGGER